MDIKKKLYRLQNIHMFMSSLQVHHILKKKIQNMQVYQKLKCVLYLHINSDTQSCILTFDSKLSTLK